MGRAAAGRWRARGCGACRACGLGAYSMSSRQAWLRRSFAWRRLRAARARFWLASSSPAYSMTPSVAARDSGCSSGRIGITRPGWGCESLLGHHEPLSEFASQDSLLVGRNFPVSEFRETRRVGPREGAGLENLAPPGSRFRANSLHFPCRSGISAQRRVRTRLPAPPTSPRFHPSLGEARGGGEDSRDSAGFWARPQGHPNRRLRGRGDPAAPADCFLRGRLGRFGFSQPLEGWRLTPRCSWPAAVNDRTCRVDSQWAP